VTSLFQKIPNDPTWAGDNSHDRVSGFYEQWAAGEAGDLFLSATG